LHPDTGKRLASLLGAAHPASLARPGDRVLTSDIDDLRRLLDTFGVEAVVVSV